MRERSRNTLWATVVSLLLIPEPSWAAAPTDDGGTVPAPQRPSPGQLFSQGRYLEAADAFGAEYERTGDPAMLFGRAQALRRAGDCSGSMAVFEQFIGTDPPATDVQEANRVIEACKEILGESEPLPPPESRPPPPPTLVSEPELAPRPSAPPRWPRDVAGGVLLGSGVAVAVVGAVVYGVGFGRARARTETEADYERRERSVRSLSAAGISLMAAGGALLVGSVIRYAVVARRNRPR